jgi:hypothetical protein
MINPMYEDDNYNGNDNGMFRFMAFVIGLAVVVVTAIFIL